MGLNIREIIPREEIRISDLKGRTLCVDAFNTIYQFLSTIRQPDGTPLMDKEKRITSHLSGIFYRNMSLLTEGTKLVYVFDGEAPELKWKTRKIRKSGRELAKERYSEAKQNEDIAAMRKYSSQMVRLNEDMINESKALLKAMGIAVIQAPGEGEAQASYFCRKKKDVYACVSQDYDSLLFKTPMLIRNLTLAKKRKTAFGWVQVKPELIKLDDVLNKLGINHGQLICLGILVGTDYNPKGIPRIGQKKALDLVKKLEIPSKIFESVKDNIDKLPEEDKFDWKEIFDLFHKPNVKDYDISFPKLNEDKIKEILVEEHDFSSDRIKKQLDKLKEIEKKNKQKNLDKWF